MKTVGQCKQWRIESCVYFITCLFAEFGWMKQKNVPALCYVVFFESLQFSLPNSKNETTEKNYFCMCLVKCS